MSQATHSHGSDKPAAFTGLIAGAIFIFIVVYGLVIWTNKKFDAHEAEAGHSAVPSVESVVESVQVA